jgi:hypothetical protein
MVKNTKIVVHDHLSPAGFQSRTDAELSNMSMEDLSAHLRDLNNWHSCYRNKISHQVQRLTPRMSDPYYDDIPF